MAITAATKTSDFAGFLTPEMAQPYFDEAHRVSVVQQLARQVPLGIAGPDAVEQIPEGRAIQGQHADRGDQPGGRDLGRREG